MNKQSSSPFRKLKLATTLFLSVVLVIGVLVFASPSLVAVDGASNFETIWQLSQLYGDFAEPYDTIGFENGTLLSQDIFNIEGMYVTFSTFLDEFGIIEIVRLQDDSVSLLTMSPLRTSLTFHDTIKAISSVRLGLELTEYELQMLEHLDIDFQLEDYTTEQLGRSRVPTPINGHNLQERASNTDPNFLVSHWFGFSGTFNANAFGYSANISLTGGGARARSATTPADIRLSQSVTRYALPVSFSYPWAVTIAPPQGNTQTFIDNPVPDALIVTRLWNNNVNGVWAFNFWFSRNLIRVTTEAIISRRTGNHVMQHTSDVTWSFNAW